MHLRIYDIVEFFRPKRFNRGLGYCLDYNPESIRLGIRVITRLCFSLPGGRQCKTYGPGNLLFGISAMNHAGGA